MDGLHRFGMKGLQWSVGIVLIIESARFAFGAGAAKIITHLGLPSWVRPALGVSEIVAAVLFLIPASVLIGGWALLIIFILAAVIHLLHGQYDVGWLFIYAMAVLVVVTAPSRKPRMRAK
jgi:hypothetical protein